MADSVPQDARTQILAAFARRVLARWDAVHGGES